MINQRLTDRIPQQKAYLIVGNYFDYDNLTIEKANHIKDTAHTSPME